MRSHEAPSGRTYHHEAHGDPTDRIYFAQEVFGRPATISISMRDVLFLAADLLRSRRIAALEELTDEELLGLPAPQPTDLAATASGSWDEAGEA
jgi:hypothetical protein